MEKNKKTKKKLKLSLGVKRILLLICSIFIIGMSLGMFILYGPITKPRYTLITTAMTTMSHQKYARWFFTEKYINKVLANNYIIEVGEDTDPDLINMEGYIKTKFENEYERDIFEGVKEDTIYKKIYVKGSGYDGYIIAVFKPEKVTLAYSNKLGTEGQRLDDMAKANDALVAMNGGGFFDPTWAGNGGIAHGTVIKGGKIISDYVDAQVGGGFIGITYENKLILGRGTKQDAIKAGIRDAIEFGPFLIINGKASFAKGDGGWGVAPRSAIAQRADGIILFAVINGRDYKNLKPGIDLVQLTELLQNYGAVNAANLDGGTSSALVEKDEDGKYELLNNPIASGGQQKVLRRIPTAWIVTE